MKKTNFNINLEILRGFAAIIVVVSHVIYHHQYFNKDYIPAYFSAFIPPAHLAVLIFFVLSGYVIGSAHKEPIEKKSIGLYLKKRFVRIYPIYFVAVLFAILISGKLSGGVILSNLTLTQNLKYEVIWQTNPAWSLNYEALYYLLFIPISLFNIRSGYAFLASLLIGVINLFHPLNAIVTAYTFGFCFWTMGLWMARNLKGDRPVKIVPVFLYLLGIENIFLGKKYFTSVLNSIKQLPPMPAKYWAQSIISTEDLIFLPVCFFIILFIAGKDIKNKFLLFAAMQMPVLLVAAKTFINHAVSPYYIVGVCFLLLSLISAFIKTPERPIKVVGPWFGKISYGIYIIHFQILCLFGLIEVAPGLYWFKLALFIIVAIFAGWLLELKLQPLVRNIFFKKAIKKPDVTPA